MTTTRKQRLLQALVWREVPANRRAWTGELAVAILTYVVMAALITWPLIAHLGSGIYGFGNDNFGGVWNTEYLHDAFWGPKELDYSRDIGYPWGSSLPLEAIQPLDWLFIIVLGGIDDGLFAYNAQVFAGYVMSGTTMFFALRWLGTARYGALALGGLFAIAPIHLALSLQYQALSNLAFLPLAVIAFIAAIRTPSFKRGVVLGLSCGLVWWGSYYYGWFGIFVIGSTLAVATLGAALHRNWAVARSRIAVSAGTAAGGAIMMGVPIILILRHIADDQIAQERVFTDLTYTLAPPWSVLLPPHDNPLLGTLTRDWLRAHGGMLPLYEQANYVGIALAGLAFAGFVLLWRRERIIAVSLLAGLAMALFLMVGPYIPHRFWSSSAWLSGAAVPHFRSLPSYLFELSPTFRYYGRAWAWGLTIAVIVSAWSLMRLRERWDGAPVRYLVVVTLIVSFGAAEYVNRPPSRWIGTEVERATWVQAVRRLPANAVIMDYPAAGYSTPRSLYYLFWTSFHNRRTVNPFLFKRGNDLYNQVNDPDSALAGQRLRQIGVSYAVVHTDLPDPTFPPYQPSWPNDALPATAGANNPWFERVSSGGDHVLYRVLDRPRRNVKATATWDASRFLNPEMEGSRAVRWMGGPEGVLQITAARRGSRLSVPVRTATGRATATACVTGTRRCASVRIDDRRYRDLRLTLPGRTYQTVTLTTTQAVIVLGDIAGVPADRRQATIRVAQPTIARPPR